MTPFLLPIIHLTWRRVTYGEWLPNTYYAKHVSAWPESGLRYIASFVLEYGLWLWLIVLLWWLIKMIGQTKTVRLQITEILKATEPASERLFTLLVIIGTVAAHVGYYTLIIGGDHFEYRVFSYLIPFIFLTMLWMLSRLTRDRVILACALGLFILVSWPIGWVHWQQSQNMVTRDATWIMKLKIAPKFPTGVKWYAEAFDDLQGWLIERHVCMRHQEHKIFYEYFSGQFPARSELEIPRAGEFPVIQYGSVGVPGWVFPKVAVIDRFGLNDYIIARHPVPPGRIRKMAHDRYAPAGYWGSFAPNYGLLINRSAGFVQRDFELTAAEIEATERYWVDYVVHDIKAPMSYLMLCRIGESLIRTRQLDTAMSALEAAIATDSTEARAYFDLASCMEKNSEYDSALALLQVADRCDPGNHKIRSREGVVLAGLGYDSFESDHDLARNYFTRSETLLFGILESVGDHAEALISLASMNLFLDRIDSSAVFLNRLEAGLEPSPGALHLLGDRYIFKKRRDLAIRAYRLAIKNGLNVNVRAVLADKYPELSAPK
jgi:tetratricopeptide (TPR) repeat protein